MFIYRPFMVPTQRLLVGLGSVLYELQGDLAISIMWIRCSKENVFWQSIISIRPSVLPTLSMLQIGITRVCGLDQDLIPWIGLRRLTSLSIVCGRQRPLTTTWKKFVLVIYRSNVVSEIYCIGRTSVKGV